MASSSFLTASLHDSLVTFKISSLALSSRDLKVYFDSHGIFSVVKNTFIPVAPTPAFIDPFADSFE